jgi:hypothetical protein
MIWYLIGCALSLMVWLYLLYEDETITRADAIITFFIIMCSWLYFILFVLAGLSVCLGNTIDKIKAWFNKVIWKK